MAFSTSNQPDDSKSSISRQDKLKECLEYHKDLINDLGITKADFTIKRGFYNSMNQQFVYVFPSEFRKEKGFYFEIVTGDYYSASKERTVYRIPNNQNYEEEYELCLTGAYSGSFIVLVDELRLVNPTAVAISGPTEAVLNAKFTTEEKILSPIFTRKTPPLANSAMNTMLADESYSNMTIRDYIAIQTGMPVSNKEWLNELVKSIYQQSR